MNKYTVTDGHGPECVFTAACPQDAARQYVVEGDWPEEAVWGDRDTDWELKVWETGTDPDDGQWYRITTTPEEIPGGQREHLR